MITQVDRISGFFVKICGLI